MISKIEYLENFIHSIFACTIMSLMLGLPSLIISAFLSEVVCLALLVFHLGIGIIAGIILWLIFKDGFED